MRPASGASRPGRAWARTWRGAQASTYGATRARIFSASSLASGVPLFAAAKAALTPSTTALSRAEVEFEWRKGRLSRPMRESDADTFCWVEVAASRRDGGVNGFHGCRQQPDVL
mmetsp:Transcript_47780/g.133212  ORF Transcript_47780/g.133212 Transcript_47780/m.133212 type:complete len:114 (-) Transcript_47780:118-459(-)